MRAILPAAILALLLVHPGAAWGEAAASAAWPGPYPGSRILGGREACIVYSEDPRRTDTEFGVLHYYRGGYERDYIRAAYPAFRIAGGLETARGLVTADGEAGQRRPASSLLLEAGPVHAGSRFTSLSDSAIAIHTIVFAVPSGTLVWEIEIQNTGPSAREIGIVPVIALRETPDRVENRDEAGNRATVAEFDGVAIAFAFTDDRNISAVRRTRAPFPSLEKTLVVAPGGMARSRMALAPTSVAAVTEACDLRTAEELWGRWMGGVARLGDLPPSDSPPVASGAFPAGDGLGSAFRAALVSVAATAQRGAVPADMTGQFVTEGRPQLYPRDALMTARVLAEAGQTGIAEEILAFWNEDIPESVPGEWYARYDAAARATRGGTGAPYDLPEWDANGYYASLALRLFALTGRRVDDSALLRRLLDFVVSRQDSEGLLTEGGIIEWVGRLPATTMNVAAGLRHGALLAEMDGDRASAARWRSAARRMERGLERLWSTQRGAYMDRREEREQFNTSANFGFVWGYPDHLELALTNAWYRSRLFRLGHGVPYFEAEGYGSDLFGFTTGASAQYHLLADDRGVGVRQLAWMMERSNVYGMMPERVLSPAGHDVSPASPLSWCNAEFAAAALAAARVADPALGTQGDWPWLMLGRDLAGLRRVLSGLAAAGFEPVRLRALAADLTGALAAIAASTRAGGAEARAVTVGRTLAVERALSRIEREARWPDPFEVAGNRERREGGAGRGRSDWREDVGMLVKGLRLVFDRLVWNEGGPDRLSLDAAFRVVAPETVVMDEPAEVRVVIASAASRRDTGSGDAVREAPVEPRWRKVTLEWRDGNRIRRRVTRVISGGRASGNEIALSLLHRLGSAPFPSGWRVTVEGTLGGVPIRASRSGMIHVTPRWEMTEESWEGGESGGVRGLNDGSRLLRARTWLRERPEHLVLTPAPGWTLSGLPERSIVRQVGTDADSGCVLREWSWRADPETGLAPGDYRFALYVMPPEGLSSAERRSRGEETAAVSVSHATQIDLAGSWRFRTGDDSRWATATASGETWRVIEVPKNWEAAGWPDYDGHAWYRRDVTIPTAWRGRDLTLVLGAVDDEDWTYWNGMLLGHTATWNQERRYRIPASAIASEGVQRLAVRVYDGLYGGGIWRGPVRLELAR